MAFNLRNFREAFQNPSIKRYMQHFVAFISGTDSGAGISKGELVEVSSNTLKTGTEQNALTLGVALNTYAASASNVEVGIGPQSVKLASPVAQFDNISPRASGKAGKTLAAQVTLVTAKAGGNFANQPAGDGVTVVSDSTADITQTATIYGTITGATTSLTTEVISLNGTTDADSTVLTWVTIVAVELSAACAGTVEISETSGGAAITSITAATLQAGVEIPTTTNGYGLIPRHDASGASTKILALWGTGNDGAALSITDALNGTTEEDHATTNYGTITKVFIGDVESSVNVTILTNDSTDSNICGAAIEASTVAGVNSGAWIKPFFM